MRDAALLGPPSTPLHVEDAQGRRFFIFMRRPPSAVSPQPQPQRSGASSLAFSPLRICGRDRRGKRTRGGRGRRTGRRGRGKIANRMDPLCHVLCSLTSRARARARAARSDAIPYYSCSLANEHVTLTCTLQTHSTALLHSAVRSPHGTSPSFLPSLPPSQTYKVTSASNYIAQG